MAGQPRRSIVAQPLDKLSYLQAPVGWDTDTPEMYVGDQHAKTLDNFIPRNGKIFMREPFTSPYGDWNTSTTLPNNIRGHAIIGPNVYLGQALSAIGSQQKLNHDEMLWAAGAAGAVITPSATQTLITSFGAGLPSNATPSVGTWPGKSYASTPAGVYYVTGPTGSGNGPNGLTYAFTRLAIIYPVGTYGIISTNTSCPDNPTSVKIYQSRLWVLGGTVSGQAFSTYYLSTNLFFSNPISSTNGATSTAAWVDPVTGTQNFIAVNPDETDPGMGLASFNNRLIIFRRNSIYVMTGTTPSNWTVTLLSKNYGCVDQQSIVETDHGVYFMSDNGYCICTGTSVSNISGRVQQSLTSAITYYTRYIVGSGTGGGDITAAYLNDGTIMVSIRTCAGTGGQWENTIWSGVFNPMTGEWYRMTSYLFANLDTNYNNNGYSYDGLPGYLLNSQELHSTLSIGNKRTVRIETPATNTLGEEGDLYRQTGYDNYAGVTNYTIPIRWVSGLLSLETVGRFHSLGIRWWVDFAYQTYLGGTTPATITVSLWDAIQATTLSSIYLNCLTGVSPPPIGTTPVPVVGAYWLNLFHQNLPPLQHQTADVPMEITHAQVALERTIATDPNPTVGIDSCEIYGVGVEYQQTRNLR